MRLPRRVTWLGGLCHNGLRRDPPHTLNPDGLISPAEDDPLPRRPASDIPRFRAGRGIRWGWRACFGLTALAIAACVLAACGGTPRGTLVPNRAPRIELTGGPKPGGTDFYAVAFQWNAWDDDGQVDHFLYCVDSVDTTWTRSDQHEATLIFPTPNRLSDTRFSGWHTFYIKAVDREGAESEIASRTFNATTVVPSTFALRPQKVVEGSGISSPLSGGPTLRLAWDGTDPDGVLHAKPVAYDIVRVIAPGNIAGNWSRARDLISGPDAVVERVPGDSTDRVFRDLAPLGRNVFWLFWVRAVDEAGAVEQWPARSGQWPGYFFFYFAHPNVQGPTLTIGSAALGSFESQGLSANSTEYVFNRPISLQWSADATEYGSDVEGYRWGVDVTDTDNPNDPGWATGWGRAVRGFSGLVFRDTTAPKHALVIQARDSNGGVTTATILVTLIDFPLDRDILFVDDESETSGGGSYPTDAQHHDFMLGALGDAMRAVGRPQTIPLHNVFRDQTKSDAIFPPQISDLAHYRVVVWDAGRPPAFNTLYGTTASSPSRPPDHLNPLALYLEAGGSLLISGSSNARSTVRDIQLGQTFIGPANGLGPNTRNFAFDYWRLPAKVRFIYTNTQVNGMRGAEPTADGTTLGMPALHFDTVRWYQWATTGPGNMEALDDLATASRAPGDRIVPLYTYVSNAGKRGSGGSAMHGLVDAQLFQRAPQTEDEDHAYQVAYFGFPFYFFPRAEVTQTLTSVLREFYADKKWAAPQRSAATNVSAAPPTR